MKERTLPEHFKDLEQHDRLAGEHVELFVNPLAKKLPKGTQATFLCECCGVAPAAGPGHCYNIVTSIARIPKDTTEPIKGYDKFVTIKDRVSPTLDIHWRVP